jgi:cell wall-associated NlpC family hydrolase
MDLRPALASLIALAALAVPAAAGAQTPTGGAAYAAPAAGGTASLPAVAQAEAVATLAADGTAIAPAGAPDEVVAVIAAANRIARLPYRYGGGHRSFKDTGYDCSGSVSFALRGAALIESPLASTGLERWGEPGAGDWITVYANKGHAFMVVAGLRFDTSGQKRTGSRWQPMDRSARGFVVRHPAGF